MTCPRDFPSDSAFAIHAAFASELQSKMNLASNRSPEIGGRPPLLETFFFAMFLI